MKKVYRVQNGVVRAQFSKRAIDDMVMLGLVKFRGTNRVGDEVRYIYTASGDDRRPVK